MADADGVLCVVDVCVCQVDGKEAEADVGEEVEDMEVGVRSVAGPERGGVGIVFDFGR